MTQIITKDLLTAMGLDLPEEQLDELVEQANATLQERIGAEITESLDDEQLKEFLEVQQAGDGTKTAEWLTENVPELKEIVEDERDILLGEIAEDSEKLV